MGRQTAFKFRTWGGKRKDAGRKPKGKKAGVPHVRRPRLSEHHPVHVTLRIVDGLPTMRSPSLLRAVREALKGGKQRFGMRLVHYSIQSNHMHCVIEAVDRRALSRGMRGLDIRLARRINAVLGRHGRVMADRYHARALKTPREVRNVLAYVLLNRRRHGSTEHVDWDLASSGVVFDGWRDRVAELDVDAVVIHEISQTRAPPHKWLLRVGWRRRGLIDPAETVGRDRDRRPARRR